MERHTRHRAPISELRGMSLPDVAIARLI